MLLQNRTQLTMNVYYEEKIAVYEAEEAELKRRSRWYLCLKLLFFGGILGFSYLSYKDITIINIGMAVMCAILYIVLYIIDDKCLKQIDYIRRKQQVCKCELAYLRGDFTHFSNGEEYMDMHHEYAFDLDMFGENSLFHRINRTVTLQGSDILASKLKNVSIDKESIRARQVAVDELKGMTDWRIDFLAYPKMQCRLDEFAAYAEAERYDGMMLRTVLPYIVTGITCCVLLLGLFDVMPMRFFYLLFFLQLLIVQTVRRPMLRASEHLRKLYKEFSAYTALLGTIGEARFNSLILNGLSKKLFEDMPNSRQAFTELERLLNQHNMRNNELMNAVLNGVLLFDVFWIRKFARWSRTYLNSMERWVECIAEIDAYVSLATYAFNNPQNVQAVVLEGDTPLVFSAKGIYHPFLTRDIAVPNDFILQKHNVAIVTGANMAGKSTFLRTVGVSYVMACNGLPVCAEEFRITVVSLFSSMRTSDNLSDNISYFNAELIRLKQLLTHIKNHRFTLIILDEILKGTNSKDKLEGSVMFLHEIAQYNVSAIVATHDLELARIEESEGNIYKNYCFEIELSDDIRYSYKIKRGVVQNLNASYLLSKFLLEDS